MTGRLDNPRVGYFTNPLTNFSDGQQRVNKNNLLLDGVWSPGLKIGQRIYVENR